MTEQERPRPRTTIGLDLSITATGLADNHGDCSIMGNSGTTKLPLRHRLSVLKRLRADIVHWTGLHAPDLVLIELPAFSRTGGGAVERHWLYLDVIDGLHAHDLTVVEVTATQRMLYATGKGRAEKTQIVDAVARRFPNYPTAGNDNICDAVILAAMGADHLGHPIAPMPQTHRAALAKVQWPVLIGDN